MEAVLQTLNALNRTTSTTEKKKILAEAPEEFLTFAKWYFDDSQPSGIKAQKLLKAIPIHENLLSFFELIEYIQKNPTGTQITINKVAAFCAAYPEYPILPEIFMKTYKCGVTKTLLNAVFPDFIQTIGIMRGQNMAPKLLENHSYCISEKLDGNRRICINTNNTTTFYTRSGKPDLTLYDTPIYRAMRQYPDERVYDGELLTNLPASNSIEERQLTTSAANSHSKESKSSLCFWVFDTLPYSEYKCGLSTFPGLERKKYLETLPNTRYAAPLPTLHYSCSDLDEIMSIAQSIWDNGGEGIMLLQTDSFYKVSASPQKTLLKVKNRVEHTAIVTGITEGTGKFINVMGSLQVQLSNGISVSVGTGFTDEERLLYFQYPDLILHQQIELESFGESTDKHGNKSLNCPVFKRVTTNEIS